MGIKLRERMRSIKVFIIGIIILVGLMGIAAFFLPSKVTVSKSVLINATEAEVAKEIGDFNNWKNWYPAFQNQNVAVTTPQKNAAVVILTDERQRKLTMTLLRSRPENFDILLFAEGKNNIAWQFILSSNSTGQTQLTWNINTTFPWYPWKKIEGIFLDKVTGPQYLEILQNLKMTVEMHHEGSPR